MGAQTQLLLAQQNAENIRYVFSSKKSKIMLLNGNVHDKLPLQFNNGTIDYSSTETHLGLCRTDNGKASAAVEGRIQVGRRTANAMMGVGCTSSLGHYTMA